MFQLLKEVMAIIDQDVEVGSELSFGNFFGTAPVVKFGARNRR